MPYYIEEGNAACAVGEWATVKEDGELMGCHATKDEAIDQGVAIALSEDSTFEGERSEVRLDSGPGAVIVDIDGTLIIGGRANQRVIAYVDSFDDTEIIVLTARLETERADTLDELEAAGVDFDQLIMKPDADIDSADFKEAEARRLLETFNVMVAIDNDPDNRERFRGLGITALDTDEVPDVEMQDDRELRQVDLSPPAYMRASARRGLQWHEEGLSGDGLQPETVREARAMGDGSVTADKWVRIRAFLARHMVDFDAPAASPGNDGFPSPGVVAIALWGGGTSKRSAQRASDYADGVIGRIEAENEGRAKGQALSKMETRINSAEFEVRETEEGMSFSGYAAVFNSDSQPLPFTERIAPGAFRGSLRNRNDIKLLWNHETGQPLASTRAGNLRLTEDDRGLYVEATLPQTSVGRDASVLIRDGIVDSMSFGFTVARGGDEWSADGSTRTLTKISLHEVSIVSFPAYTATAGSTAVRGLDKVAKRAEVDPDALADALLKIENGEDITTDDRNLVTTVLEKLSPAVEEPKGDLDMLALKKKKLELLMGL
jgi:uncharacterized protein